MVNTLYENILIFIEFVSPFTLVAIVISFLAIFIGKMMNIFSMGDPSIEERGRDIGIYGGMLFPITVIIFDFIPIFYGYYF